MRPSDSRFLVLGVDPGGVDTGMVVRECDQVVYQLVAHRAADETGPRGVGVGPEYLRQLTDCLEHLVEVYGVHLVAIEGVVRPNPHVNRRNGRSVTDPGPIIATAIVLGHVHATATALGRDVVWVPPGRNGSLQLAAYPAQLVSDRERAKGLNRVGDSGILRHARSAYDVAGAGLLLARLRASTPAR